MVPILMLKEVLSEDYMDSTDMLIAIWLMAVIVVLIACLAVCIASICMAVTAINTVFTSQRIAPGTVGPDDTMVGFPSSLI